MIDLHMHTKHSDGTDSVINLLDKVEKNKLEIVSITDHNSVEAYYDIQKLGANLPILYKGLIIKGCEFSTSFEGRSIEVLGYHFNVDKIHTYLQKYYSPKKKKAERKFLYHKLLSILDKHSIVYDKKKIKINWSLNTSVEKSIYIEMMNHEENKDILKGVACDSFSDFYRKELTNSDSIFYIDYPSLRPSIKEVTGVIHDAGGIALLAHPYQYKFEDTEVYIDQLMALTKLDGLECFYTMFTKEQTDYLVNYCTKYNLLMSGGSDHHGENKPGHQLGVGLGNLHIDKEIVGKWLERPRPGHVLDPHFDRGLHF